jgi:hypothetical protein
MCGTIPPPLIHLHGVVFKHRDNFTLLYKFNNYVIWMMVMGVHKRTRYGIADNYFID